MTDTPVHVSFIHGLANKPASDELLRIWLEALKTPTEDDGGFSLRTVGVSASMIYWADLFYPAPIPASEYESAANKAEELGAAVTTTLRPPTVWETELLGKLGADIEAPEDAPVDAQTEGYERIPLPGDLKKKLMRHFTKEAHDYLFNQDGIRDTIRARAMEDFSKVPAGTRHVLVGHSQGTFIAYDVLTGVKDCKTIDGLLTLGSPLGLDEVQDQLTWSRENGFPEKLQGDWVNVYDPFDVVARPDPILGNDFRKNGAVAVIDVEEENWGTWRHSATKYFKGNKLRNQFRRLCGREEG